MLNLVNTVAFNKTSPTPIIGTQSHTYAADGTKLSFKQVAGKIKSYVGAVEYDAAGVVARIGTEEGYILKRTGWNENSKDSKFVYYYSVKDHLGNVRLVLDDESNAQVWRKTDYHAFGIDANNTYPQGPKAGKEKNDRLYNGKELDSETTWLDYGFRQYDNVLGRWMCVDPMSEKFYSLTPYNYVANNPIIFIDPDGREIDISELMKSKEHAAAFIIFAKTKEGKAFLNNYASKGQKLEYGGKVFYEAKTAGKFDKAGVDLNFKISADDQSGTTSKINGKNDSDINIEIAKEGFGSDNNTFN
jgi:RHS repeat-associated protein